eukprot:gene6059-4610_t
MAGACTASLENNPMCRMKAVGKEAISVGIKAGHLCSTFVNQNNPSHGIVVKVHLAK